MAPLKFKNPNTNEWEEVGGGIKSELTDLGMQQIRYEIDNIEVIEDDGAPRNSYALFTHYDSSNNPVTFFVTLTKGIPGSAPS